MTNFCIKITHRCDVMRLEVELSKLRSPVDRVSVRARVRLGLVSNSLFSG